LEIDVVTVMRLELNLALMLMLLFATSQAATISVPGDYASIQAAIDRASPSDVVEVECGLYRENVDVDKPLTLRGVGMPIVDAGIMVTSNDNTIKGNNARGNNLSGILLDMSSKNNIMRDNQISENQYRGFRKDIING
jgi:parallel beta-helix repeat protein